MSTHLTKYLCLPTSRPPGSIAAEEAIESIDAQRWTLSNGITVIAKKTDFKNDEVVFTAFSPGGHSLVDDVDHVSALYADDLICQQRSRPARHRRAGQTTWPVNCVSVSPEHLGTLRRIQRQRIAGGPRDALPTHNAVRERSHGSTTAYTRDSRQACARSPKHASEQPDAAFSDAFERSAERESLPRTPVSLSS